MLLAVLVAAATACAPAPAQAAATDSIAPVLEAPASQTVPPPGFRLSAREALAVAAGTPAARAARRQAPALRAEALIQGPGLWEVDLWDGDRNVVEIDVDGRTGRVLQTWTGRQAANYLARGHFAAHADAAWLWVVLCVLFVAPFLDPRRPWRLLHLDLVALLGFGVSHVFFTRGDVGTSVPLVYPVLAYLLVRLLVAGLARRRPRDRGPLVPFAPTWLLVAGALALAGLHVAVNVANADKVVDVGYASVVGADRIVHGQQLYTDNEVHGDTYGPVTYLSYIPFEAALPWHGKWDDVPAAHAAAIFFDLLTMALLALLGLRLRAGPEGRRLGAALAFAWAAFPYSMYVTATNTNDGLVAVLLVAALLALRSPAGRGLLLGLAAAAKFAPAALVPLVARGGRASRHGVGWTALAFSVAVVAAFVWFVPEGGLRELWNTTLGFQLGRDSVFSPWGQDAGLAWLQTAVKVAAVVVVLAAAAWPGERDTVRLAALSAATLIAVQLPATHWFYFYVVWFAPPALVAFLAGHDDRPRLAAAPGRVQEEDRAPGDARVPEPLASVG